MKLRFVLAFSFIAFVPLGWSADSSVGEASPATALEPFVVEEWAPISPGCDIVISYSRLTSNVTSIKVTRVDPNTPAAKAGLKAGNEIGVIDGKMYSKFKLKEIRALFYERRAGEKIRIAFSSGRTSKPVTAELEFVKRGEAVAGTSSSDGKTEETVTLTLAQAEAEARRARPAPREPGVVYKSVSADTTTVLHATKTRYELQLANGEKVARTEMETRSDSGKGSPVMLIQLENKEGNWMVWPKSKIALLHFEPAEMRAALAKLRMFHREAAEAAFAHPEYYRGFAAVQSGSDENAVVKAMLFYSDAVRDLLEPAAVQLATGMKREAEFQLSKVPASKREAVRKRLLANLPEPADFIPGRREIETNAKTGEIRVQKIYSVSGKKIFEGNADEFVPVPGLSQEIFELGVMQQIRPSSREDYDELRKRHQADEAALK